MKATGIIRRIDDLGRIVIPKEIRRQIFGTQCTEGKPMEFFIEGDSIVLKKYGEDESNTETEIRAKVIDDFIRELKGNAGGGLITSWDKPYGISYERIDELAEQMKGGAE